MVEIKNLSSLSPEVMAKLQKALTTATGGGALVDTFRDGVIADETDKRHKIWANLRKQPGKGNGALVTRRTGRGTNAGYVAETGQATTDDSAYGSESFAWKYVSSLGEIGTGLVLAGAATFGDLTMQEVADRTDEAVDAVENGLVTGNNVGNNPLGLNELMDSFDGGSQKIVPGPVDGGPLTLELLDESIDKAEDFSANLSFGVTSSRVRREINAEHQAFRRYTMESIQVNGGFRVPVYSDIPLLSTNKVADETVGASLNAQRLTWVDMNDGYWIQELLRLTPYELAKTKASSQPMEVFGIHAFVAKNRRHVSQLAEIIPPA